MLGFSVLADTRFEFGGRWVAVAPPDGSAILALVAPKRGSENYKLIGRNTQIRSSLKISTRRSSYGGAAGSAFFIPRRSLFSEEPPPLSQIWMATPLNCSVRMR